MIHRQENRYRGIAVFGAPGSGKTTLAAALVRARHGLFLVEASRDVIRQAAGLPHWPAGRQAFLEVLAGRFGRPKGVALSRAAARGVFQKLSRRYCPTVIAEAVETLRLRRAGRRPLLVAGARGFDNASRLRALGYLVVFLETPDAVAARRLARRDGRRTGETATEVADEERLFGTSRIKALADVVLDVSVSVGPGHVREVLDRFGVRQCRQCLNDTNNPTVIVGRDGLCNVCSMFRDSFNPAALRQERNFFRSFLGTGRKKYDLLVGISGGKDSTAMLATVKEMGFRTLAFTLDSGYYPRHIVARARQVAKRLGVDHVRIPIRRYARPVDLRCFELTAALYDLPDSAATRRRFRAAYLEARKHYSIKCNHALPFVRSCQLCRRLVVRAYYAAAVKYGAGAVAIGINEWAGLSKTAVAKGRPTISSYRKLQPTPSSAPVHVFHVPFMLRRRKRDTVRILKSLGWRPPSGERLVESNSNSCLFARAAEADAERYLGFHPDTTRLSREVTVGFLTRAEAQRALSQPHPSRSSVREVLHRAGLAKRR